MADPRRRSEMMRLVGREQDCAVTFDRDSTSRVSLILHLRSYSCTTQAQPIWDTGCVKCLGWSRDGAGVSRDMSP